MKNLLSIALLVFATQAIQAQSAKKETTFGKNIISISPIQIMALSLTQDDADPAVNISYERITSNEYFGIKLPVTFYLNSAYYCFMPALKIYPFGQGPVKYSFGPQFYLAKGDFKYTDLWYDYPDYTSSSVTLDRTQVGFLINNTINFTVMQNFYMGLEAALGINYYDSNADDTYLQNRYFFNREKSEFYPAFHLGFSMGYRF